MDEPEKTSLYGDQKNNKTGIYNSNDSDLNKTGLYSQSTDNKTFTSQGINIGDKIFIKNNEYTVKQIISKGTGEANVYQIEALDGNLYALKLYFEFKDEVEEPNGIALERIQKLNDADILRLIDFGVGADKYNGKYCFEISDFAQGGNILDVADFKKKYTPGFIEEDIVPQIYLAINKLHEYKIYHCDIKPGNILYKDKEQTDIIIGDYGSAKAYDLKSEKALRKSTTIKGTEFYLAPEQARGIVSEKNDYYSLGMVLLHLLYPESFSKSPDYRIIDGDKFEQIIERQYNLKPIIDFNPKLKHLNTLIEGLTLINHINRWGPEEFEKWLNGENVQVSYRTKEATDIKPLKTGPIEIYTAEEFVNYIENKSTWFEDFFEDPDVFRLIKDWLDSYIGIPDRKRFEKLIDIYKFSGKDILLSAISLFLIPSKPIAVEEKTFEFKENDKIVDEVIAYLSKIDSVYKLTPIDQLLLYFFQLEFKLNLIYYNDNANKTAKSLLFKLYNPFVSELKLAENFNFKTLIPGHLNPAKGNFNYEYLITVFYDFNTNRAYPDNEGKQIENPEELALYYLKNEKYFDDKYHAYERRALLKKFKLQSLVNADLQELISKTLAKHADISVNINHIAFEKICNVHYSIKHILNNYLVQQGVNEPITTKEDIGFIYLAKNKLFSGIAAHAFVKYLNNEHSNLSGWPTSLSDVKREFKKQHRKYFMINSIVSWVTTLFILGAFAVIILRILNIINQY